MNQYSRGSAFLAYFLLIIGWVYVLVFRRKDELAIFHVRQSITLVIVAVVTIGVWAAFGLVITVIPYAGAIIATATFALVMVASLVFFVLWITGMIFAVQQKMKPLPLTGRWADRLPF